MKKSKAPRRKPKNDQSIFQIKPEEISDYLKQIPEVIFLIFILYLGISIYTNKQKNFIYQKYLKKSLIQGRKYIDYYFPGFLANEKVFNIFDYDILLIKTDLLILILAGIYVVGAIFLLLFSSWSRKIIIFIALLIDLGLVHNLIFYRNEKLFDIIKLSIYLIILICLWKMK